MKLSLIVAMAENGVIGHNNRLPWRLSADLKHFKRITLGKPVVMGRRTWESIGKPLPDRVNIIVTRDDAYRADGALVTHSVDEALNRAGDVDEIMIIGGAGLYEQTIDRADRIYLTLVHAQPEGDTRFPEIDWRTWGVVCDERFRADEKNQYDYSFRILERRAGGQEPRFP